MDSQERAKRFKEARKDHNINKRESMRTVEEKADVKRATICKLENANDDTNVGYKDIVALADHYGVNVAWLMGQSHSPSLKEDVQIATKATGLSTEAVEQLRSMNSEEIDCLNAFITCYDFRKALLKMSQARTISKRIDKWEPSESMKNDPYAPGTVSEYADMIERSNMFQISMDENTRKKAPYKIGTGNTISDRQLVRMYRMETLQDIGNALRTIAPADDDEREVK